MPRQEVVIPGLTARLNELLRSVRARISLKKRDRGLVKVACFNARTTPATGKRRVSLTVTLGPRNRVGDPDGLWKSILDALVHAGILRGDGPSDVELGTIEQVRGKRSEMRVTLEDV